jgi:hypothetical protein
MLMHVNEPDRPVRHPVWGDVVNYDATLVLAAIERSYLLERFHPRVASNPLQNKTNGNVKRMMYVDRRNRCLSV